MCVEFVLNNVDFDSNFLHFIQSLDESLGECGSLTQDKSEDKNELNWLKSFKCCKIPWTFTENPFTLFLGLISLYFENTWFQMTTDFAIHPLEIHSRLLTYSMMIHADENHKNEIHNIHKENQENQENQNKVKDGVELEKHRYELFLQLLQNIQ